MSVILGDNTVCATTFTNGEWVGAKHERHL
jgi:hypothetical protein